MGIDLLSILAIHNIVVAFAHLQYQVTYLRHVPQQHRVRRTKPSIHAISIFNRSFSAH